MPAGGDAVAGARAASSDVERLKPEASASRTRTLEAVAADAACAHETVSLKARFSRSSEQGHRAGTLGTAPPRGGGGD